MKRIPHSGFFIVCLLIVLTPAVFKTVRSLVLSSQGAQELIIVEGEKPIQTNVDGANARFPRKKGFFSGRSVELDSSVVQPEGYYFKYDVLIPEDGNYNLFLAGTPPGPKFEGSKRGRLTA